MGWFHLILLQTMEYLLALEYINSVQNYLNHEREAINHLKKELPTCSQTIKLDNYTFSFECSASEVKVSVFGGVETSFMYAIIK